MTYSGPQDPNLLSDVLNECAQRLTTHRRRHLEVALHARPTWIASALGTLKSQGLIREWSTDLVRLTDLGRAEVERMKAAA